jgi:hypothetical protein
MKPTILIFILLLVPAVFPQQNGILEGRLINLTDASITPRGVELEVIELGAGMSIIQSAATDERGRFRITGLPADRKLMLRATYKGSNYHSQVAFSGGRANVEIGVYEPTESMKDIEVQSVQMAFQLVGDQLKALETVTFNNKTKPPRTFFRPEGTFRVSKLPGILEPPQMRVTAPGSSMPLVQSALESADGTSYYSLYPIRPGITTFEVQQLLPYMNKAYTYVKKFYHDAGSVSIGVIPQDMNLSGPGLSKVETNAKSNFSVYAGGPVKAGTEVVWNFSGGTPVPEAAPQQAPAGEPESEVTSVPNAVGRNTLIIGSLLLMGFVAVLWYAFNHPQGVAHGVDSRVRESRDQLLDEIAELDRRIEQQPGEPGLLKQREERKRKLRRISMLLKSR